MLFSRLFQASSTCFYPISAINEQSSIKKISRKHPPPLKLWRTGEIMKTGKNINHFYPPLAGIFTN